MIRIKTITQYVNQYEVPEVLQADFFRWLALSDQQAENFQVENNFINELIIHVDRVPEPDSPESAAEDSTSQISSGYSTGHRGP